MRVPLPSMRLNPTPGPVRIDRKKSEPKASSSLKRENRSETDPNANPASGLVPDPGPRADTLPSRTTKFLLFHTHYRQGRHNHRVGNPGHRASYGLVRGSYTIRYNVSSVENLFALYLFKMFLQAKKVSINLIFYRQS